MSDRSSRSAIARQVTDAIRARFSNPSGSWTVSASVFPRFPVVTIDRQPAIGHRRP